MSTNLNIVKIPNDFFWETYLNLNPELQKNNNNKEKAELHYIKCGIKEKRSYKYKHLPSDFYFNTYMKINTDLKQNFNKKKFKEILENEKGIIIPNNTELLSYLKNNELIDYYNNKLSKYAKFHYETYGFKEGRQYKIELPIDFVWSTYLKLNSELSSICNDENGAIQHYKNTGYFEGRQYKIEVPSDFVWSTYLKLNSELSSIFNDENGAIQHYKNIGYFEGRQYKIEIPGDFVWSTYLKLNSDICNICNDEISAIYHFLNYGYFENRIYTVNNLFHKYNYLYTQKDLIENYDTTILHNNITYYNFEINNSQLHIDYLKNTHFNCSYETIDNLNLLKSFILVIDFPNYGGGTEFFINTIISKYKKNNTFLIIRPDNGLIKVLINDEQILSVRYTEIEMLAFLNKNIDNIIKIFINHTIVHNDIFLIELLKINKEKIYVTHDYYLINNKPQPFYNQICDERTGDPTKININMFDKIITQNINNYHIFKKFIHSDKKIIVTPLPDFNTELDFNFTNNSKIIIGIIGTIHSVKGELIVKELIDYINNNNLNMEVVIFGGSSIKYVKQQKYNSIFELNDLLITYKPNILLDATIWNETYSYTLSLSMITQLPILSLKKPFLSVIKNRLSNYNNAFYYSTINELIALINEKNQNFFYTINPVIYFNSFWKKMFN